MARDHALAVGLPPGAGAVRLYGWIRPTLSLGRNEPARGAYDASRLRRDGVDVVRRPTGGRAVLHHRELTYAVAVPVRSLGGPREAYRLVSLAIVRGLSLLGVEAEIAGSGGPTPRPDAGPCFREPAEGEVVVRGRKLVGSAQARLADALLQHGSILLEDDQGRLDALGGRAAAGSPATLAEVLGRAPDVARVAEAVLAGLREALPGTWTEEAPRVDAATEAELEERYRSDAWTWRR